MREALTLRTVVRQAAHKAPPNTDTAIVARRPGRQNRRRPDQKTSSNVSCFSALGARHAAEAAAMVQIAERRAAYAAFHPA